MVSYPQTIHKWNSFHSALQKFLMQRKCISPFCIPGKQRKNIKTFPCKLVWRSELMATSHKNMTNLPQEHAQIFKYCNHEECGCKYCTSVKCRQVSGCNIQAKCPRYSSLKAELDWSTLCNLVGKLSRLRSVAYDFLRSLSLPPLSLSLSLSLFRTMHHINSWSTLGNSLLIRNPWYLKKWPFMHRKVYQER